MTRARRFAIGNLSARWRIRHVHELLDFELPDELVEVVADPKVSPSVLALRIAVKLVPYVHFVLASELELLHLT